MRLFLIGMMGSGKSFWAKRIAEKYNWHWTDLDTIIEKEHNKTIQQIFATEGEQFFREEEHRLLQKTNELENILIATGGGTPCFYNNMQWMNENGITVWIDESIDILTQRLIKEKGHRPLIRDLSDHELADFLASKRKERSMFYSQCKYHLQNENISERSFAEILSAL